MREEEYVILGGGAAGLSAAMRFLEKGVSPLLIEAGHYPSHKVCGEFFSPSSLPLLQQWKIQPQLIYQARFYTASQQLNFTFPSPAGSLSHLTFDPLLVQRVIDQGGKVLTQTQVQSLQPATRSKEPHVLLLSTGEKILAKHLLIATGRIPHLFFQKPQMHYVGFKAHFSGLSLDSTLEMFSFPGAYLGLVPIEEGKANLACLARRDVVQQSLSSQEFITTLISQHPILRERLVNGTLLFERWMEAHVPKFGQKILPHWPRTYFIGDAAGTIPPACGNGLSLALISGYLAADFALRNDVNGFKKNWSKRCQSQFLYGKGLHYLFLHPHWSNWGFQMGNYFPSLVKTIFHHTRDSGL